MLQLPGVSTEAPEYLLSLTQQDLDEQPVRWKNTAKWSTILTRYPQVVEALIGETASNGGRITRRFVHSYAAKDEIELFLVAMAWGFGTKGTRWPGHRAVLDNPPTAEISGIVEAVRSRGAEAGWRALTRTHKIAGFGYAFGTKLLHFAAYTADIPGPKPLILDANVLDALHDAGTGILASDGVWRADYLAYLELAEAWSKQPTWEEGSPDLVEYGLFVRGQELGDIVKARRKDR